LNWRKKATKIIEASLLYIENYKEIKKRGFYDYRKKIDMLILCYFNFIHDTLNKRRLEERKLSG
jgi:hypothetical protein